MAERSSPAWRIGVWVAVSSKQQAADDKISLSEQERRGREFAQQVGGDVVAVYRVPGHTRDIWRWSTAEAQMPAYRELREDVEAGKLDVLWVLESSRLGRDPALVQAAISLVEKEGGGEVYRADAPHTLGQKAGAHRFLDAFGAVQAQQENVVRTARHRAGMRGRVKRGLIPSNAPLGYRVVRDADGRSIGHEFSADIGAVQAITDAFLAGLSYAEILRRLDADGVRRSSGEPWNLNTIYGVIRNDTYAGWPSWGAFRYEGETPSDKYPALWDAETFAAVIRERKRRRKRASLRRGGGPFSGVVFCRGCGRRMVRAMTGVYIYYRCWTHAQKSVTGQSCTSKAIRQEDLVDAMTAALERYSTPERIDAALAELEDSAEQQRLEAERARLETELTGLAAERDRLAGALARGLLDATMYRRQDDERLQRQAALDKRLGEVGQELDALPDWEQRRADLMALAGDFAWMVQEADEKAMAKALQDSGVRIWVADGLVVDVRLD